MVGKKPLPVRVDDRMRTELEARASADGLRASTWAREILAAVLATKLTAFELQAVLKGRQQRDPQELTDGVVARGPRSTNGRQLGRRVILTGECLCPVHLRRQFPTFDVCVACGTRHDRV
jgi:hypothetical protein